MNANHCRLKNYFGHLLNILENPNYTNETKKNAETQLINMDPTKDYLENEEMPNLPDFSTVPLYEMPRYYNDLLLMVTQFAKLFCSKKKYYCKILISEDYRPIENKTHTPALLDEALTKIRRYTKRLNKTSLQEGFTGYFGVGPESVPMNPNTTPQFIIDSLDIRLLGKNMLKDIWHVFAYLSVVQKSYPPHKMTDDLVMSDLEYFGRDIGGGRIVPYAQLEEFLNAVYTDMFPSEDPERTQPFSQMPASLQDYDTANIGKMGPARYFFPFTKYVIFNLLWQWCGILDRRAQRAVTRSSSFGDDEDEDEDDRPKNEDNDQISDKLSEIYYHFAKSGNEDIKSTIITVRKQGYDPTDDIVIKNLYTPGDSLRNLLLRLLHVTCEKRQYRLDFWTYDDKKIEGGVMRRMRLYDSPHHITEPRILHPFLNRIRERSQEYFIVDESERRHGVPDLLKTYRMLYVDEVKKAPLEQRGVLDLEPMEKKELEYEKFQFVLEILIELQKLVTYFLYFQTQSLPEAMLGITPFGYVKRLRDYLPFFDLKGYIDQMVQDFDVTNVIYADSDSFNEDIEYFLVECQILIFKEVERINKGQKNYYKRYEKEKEVENTNRPKLSYKSRLFSRRRRNGFGSRTSESSDEDDDYDDNSDTASDITESSEDTN